MTIRTPTFRATVLAALTVCGPAAAWGQILPPPPAAPPAAVVTGPSLPVPAPAPAAAVEPVAPLETAPPAASPGPFGPPAPAYRPPSLPPGGVRLRQVFGTPGEAPRFPTATLTGLLQVDQAFFAQSAPNRAAVGDVEDASAVRRLRLGGFGEVGEHVTYYVEVDFAQQGGTALADTFLTLTDLDQSGLVPGDEARVGFFRQPVGMMGRMGARVIPFLERPLPFALTPFRQVGVGLNGFDEDSGLSWEGTVYRFPSDTDGGVLGDRGGYSTAGRLSARLGGRGDRDALLHLGLSGAFQSTADDAVRFRSRPETFAPESRGVTGSAGTTRAVPPFVDTGVLAAEYVHVAGAELAGRAGSAWFRSEYLNTRIDAPGSGGPEPTFDGFYAMAGLILTGEVLPYDLPTATFGRVAPSRPFDPGAGDWGAVEVLARVSTLDLSDAGVNGGELTDLSAGVNWYLTARCKFQFNYIRAFLNEPGTATGPLAGRTDVGGSAADVIAVRAQIDF